MTEHFTLRHSTVTIDNTPHARAALLRNLADCPTSVLPGDLPHQRPGPGGVVAAVLRACHIAQPADPTTAELTLAATETALDLHQHQRLQIILGFLAPYARNRDDTRQAPVMEWISTAGTAVRWVFFDGSLQVQHGQVTYPDAPAPAPRALAVTLDFDVTYRESHTVTVPLEVAARRFADPLSPTVAEMRAWVADPGRDWREAFSEIVTDDVVALEVIPDCDIDIELDRSML